MILEEGVTIPYLVVYIWLNINHFSLDNITHHVYFFIFYFLLIIFSSHFVKQRDPFCKQLIIRSYFQNQFVTPKNIHNVSQIDGPTPKNSFGFKISFQNIQDAKALHEVNSQDLMFSSTLYKDLSGSRINSFYFYWVLDSLICLSWNLGNVQWDISGQ